MPGIKATEFTNTLDLQPVIHPVPADTTKFWAARVGRIDAIGKAFLRYGWWSGTFRTYSTIVFLAFTRTVNTRVLALA